METLEKLQLSLGKLNQFTNAFDGMQNSVQKLANVMKSAFEAPLKAVSSLQASLPKVTQVVADIKTASSGNMPLDPGANANLAAVANSPAEEVVMGVTKPVSKSKLQALLPSTTQAVAGMNTASVGNASFNPASDVGVNANVPSVVSSPMEKVAGQVFRSNSLVSLPKVTQAVADIKTASGGNMPLDPREQMRI